MFHRATKVKLAIDGINLVESSCGRGVAQFGSALGLGPRGRWFESSRPDHLLGSTPKVGGSTPLTGAVPIHLSTQCFHT